MSSGIFGSVRPAKIEPYRDAEILYLYRPTRSTEDDDFDGYQRLDASECLIPSITNDDKVRINGVYDLRLPLDKFNRKGFYSIYIRPREIRAKITDVSVLAAYPDVRGVVFNIAAIDSDTDLTGYRLEFEDKDETRIIKSCNRCAPVTVAVGDGYPKATRYVIGDTSSDLVFCTVSPSSAPSFNQNANPYIGIPGENVILTNTKFTPKLIEVEMVDHDADTISYMLEGDQVRDRDHSVITTYNDENEIYQQYDYYTIKSRLGKPLYDIKRKRDILDTTQSHDNVMNL